MTSKPVYQGTYTQYQALPREVKQYYSPPVETPAGYEVSKVETVYPKQVYGVTYGTQAKPQPTPPYEQVTFTPIAYEIPTNLFGPKTFYYNPKTGVRTEELTTLQGEKILVTVNPKAEGSRTASPLEQQALSGVALATTVATGVAVPMAGVTALGTVGAVATVKGAVRGKALTPEEAISAASAGTILYFGAKAFTPYARQFYRSAVSRLDPERALYNRVVLSQQAQQQTLTDKLIGKLSPERALYQRITKTPPSFKPEGGEFTGGGGAQQWVQQQVLFKQVAVQKAPMKNFLPTMQVASKTVTVPTQSSIVKEVLKTEPVKATQKMTIQQRSMTQTVQQQVVNPFLVFPGKPFYRKASKEQEEYAYIVYPMASPVATPTQITSPSMLIRQQQRETTTPLLRDLLGQTPVAGLNPLQSQSQLTEQIVGQTQIQKQIQEQTQIQQQQQRQEQKRYYDFGGFDLTPGFKRLSKDIFGKYGRYRRIYPLKTPSQMLKEVLK